MDKINYFKYDLYNNKFLDRKRTFFPNSWIKYKTNRDVGWISVEKGNILKVWYLNNGYDHNNYVEYLIENDIKYRQKIRKEKILKILND